MPGYYPPSPDDHFARFAGALTIGHVRRKTVAHFCHPHWWAKNMPTVGEHLVGIPSSPVQIVDGIPTSATIGRTGLRRRIISVSEVKLLNILTDEELHKLDRDIDDYMEGWDKLHPEAPVKTNPIILRIETERNGPIVRFPHSFEELVIQVMTAKAHQELVAQEDARVFGTLLPS